MKDITKKNAEKIAHNIHRKLDDLIQYYKYQGKPMYRVERNTLSGWICFKVIPETKDFITGSVMDDVQDLAKKYKRSYNGVLYSIGINRGEKGTKPTFEIIIEIK